MINSIEGSPRIAMLCNPDGEIIQIIQDEFGIEIKDILNRSLTFLVDQDSIGKALNFLSEIKDKGAALNWDLNIQVSGQTYNLHFIGINKNDNLLIFGANTIDEAFKICEKLAWISREQINNLRSLINKQTKILYEKEEKTHGLYNEIAHLNNELVNMQRELARKNAQLESLNEQKDQFLGMVVHDLRASLGIIIMYSRFLLEEASEKLDAEHREFLSIIHSSSDSMLQMVNDLLDVAKNESGNLQLRPERVDLQEIFEHNISLNRVMASKKKIELRYFCNAYIPKLMLDASKIRQVLNNLIGNAIKFSYPGSKIEILLTRESNDVVISVKDEGNGIPAEDYNKIFEPFARSSMIGTDGEKSSGLGLAIARRIVEGHKGRIWFESEVGVGSTFYFSLPIDENEIKG